MSVNSNTYVVFGIKLDYDELYDKIENSNKEDLWEELLDKYRESAFGPAKEDFSIIPDGMDGEYVVIGKVLDKTEVYESFPGFANLTISDAEKIEVMSKIMNLMEELEVVILHDFPKLLVFTHYT